ncbi:2-phosphoxylose phosphatase 1 isoform X1 [Gallus gallus]|uniref:2-phosphoxylose phosphatase 1 n=1 Tax=Gallus gallus TaxID=9031 RepID=A0A1D5P8H0_CHICK|nr:2-phosphoxylose phosphatase 1 isoform X1 [Gallus gallus]XP_040535017.1 2-phosphoxylose phosphatase 1 isoform X1 [Gallus gallus]|eukprot:XP_015132522.1 2-phosphoxylose phosphatase 1 isoform X1 [Gallus gallus]
MATCAASQTGWSYKGKWKWRMILLPIFLYFVHLIPVNPIKEDGLNPKSRKRIMPDLLTEPPAIDPVYEAHVYCNIPTIAERSMEGYAPHYFKLASVQVLIRHGDRYPLYAIPKTKRPDIDCTLLPNRKPSHPQLEAFIKHMSKGSAAQMDGTLSSLPRYPSHSLCEMGELTQTGVVQHLRNGQLLRETYINKHKLLLNDWTAKQLYLETTGKSRTLQSALALLYTFLPDFDWKKINMRHQWSTIFCSGSCDCPMRNHYLEEEQRRQYSLRVKNNDLEKIYVDMAKIVGIPTRQLRASNPIDSLLCYFCHNVSFPCTKTGCIGMEHFKVIKRHQLEDERERQEKKLYFLYALLATHPLLNQTVNRFQRIAEGKKEEIFVLHSAHDVTLSPVLSALGITEARFPRFAARLVFELWQDGKRPKEHFIRILYNGADVTFQTSFCKDYYKRSSKPMCPLEKFVSFVKRDMFLVFNSTSYYDACHRRPL